MYVYSACIAYPIIKGKCIGLVFVAKYKDLWLKKIC